MFRPNINLRLFLPALIMLGMLACTTDPIIPAGGIPVIPPVQDPGEADLCPSGKISFQHQVLPIMISACAYSGCHDVVSAAEGVVLDSYERVIKEVKPGNPNGSALIEYLGDGGDDAMPPPPAMSLNHQQIQLIRNWIDQGAENTDCGTSCISTRSSFSADIFPLLQDYCIGCHNNARLDGDVNLANYNEILPYVENGSLIGSIKDEVFYPVMPPTGSQLSTCRISQIEKWIEEGALDN